DYPTQQQIVRQLRSFRLGHRHVLCIPFLKCVKPVENLIALQIEVGCKPHYCSGERSASRSLAGQACYGKDRVTILS
ncbi:MAG: hypothetical protein AB7G88_14105, partial [Thermomicrobiales bacterium]